MTMKTSKTSVENNIVVSVPDTIEQKMQAIVNLSQAIAELSKALSSTHINATVTDCCFTAKTGTCLTIGRA